VISEVGKIGSSAVNEKYVTLRRCNACLDRGDYRCYD